MRKLELMPAFVVLLAGPVLAEENEPWISKTIISDFHAEGAGIGDLNGDGKSDVTYGPFWFEGPEFEGRHRFAEGEAFDGTRGYSDSFFPHVFDADGDGDADLLVVGFPGEEARLYRNPGPGGDRLWEVAVVAPEVSNESPHVLDFVPGGLPEIVGTRGGAYGYYESGSNAFEPWVWHPVSEAGAAGGAFEHGLGVGDLNGDGKPDIVASHWWFENTGANLPWPAYRWNETQFPGGAQILIDDFDGDGDSDIVTSLAAHGYGLSWFEQTEDGVFQARNIMGDKSTDSPFGVCFSQIHALTLVDIDRDGRMDFVTGMRYFAHQGKDAGELDEPLLYWFRNTKADEGIEFVPHRIDNNSGVGVEVKAADLNGDGKADVITSSKKGLILHFQNPQIAVTSNAAEKWKVAGGRSQENYGSGLSPKEALGRMEAPEGFAVDLIAAEPDITQPIAMCFDARGRIWMIEGKTYPERAKEGEGKDRILILEDADRDGSFETRKVFAENLNLASGLEIGFGGVFVGAAPNLLFYPDKDRDDVPDSEPEILLDGWGFEDTHETLNAFTWGPDGWLYGCHGVFTHSRVGKPGTPDDERVPINAGVWRFDPINGKFEVFAQGTSNPWGLDFDEYGEFFISACVIPHFYHLSEGGRYQRQAGQHFQPHTYDDIKTIADHAHYAGNIRDHAFWGPNFTDRPPAPTDTSALGGGHAHCGLVYYDAPEFPAQYRKEMFFHNLHGHRIVREHLEASGSGYVARHRPDFVMSNNHDFVGVGIMQGPDGALYFADWTDPQTCHHRDVEIWDRSNGRIFRVRNGEAKTAALDLPSLDDISLVNLLGSENAVVARLAQRVLSERHFAKTLQRESVRTALAEFERRHAGNTPLLLRALWTKHVTGMLSDEQVANELSSPDPHLRAWATRFSFDEKWQSRLLELARNDNSPVVRRHLASKLQSLSPENAWLIAEALVAHDIDAHDRNIPLLVWYGVEPLVEGDPARALALADKTSWPQLKDFIFRRATSFPKGREAVAASLADARDVAQFKERASKLLGSLGDDTAMAMPEGWAKVRAKAESLGDDPALAITLNRLAARFRDPACYPFWRQRAADDTLFPSDRADALNQLTLAGDFEKEALARGLLGRPETRPAALAALRDHPGEETATAIIAILPDLDQKLRNEAINFLATRPDMALSLLTAVDEGRVATSLVSPVLLDQFERFENEEISKLVAANWARGGALDEGTLTAATARWQEVLRPEILAKADASHGREVFANTCGICHQLFGEGTALGPDLTGSNRADTGYLLENVLAPSSVVGRDYFLHILELQDGSTASGMVTTETPELVELAMPGGSVTKIEKSNITSRQELPQSLMPAGLFDSLPEKDVIDLVKYLASPNQVPLRGEGKGDGFIPPAKKGSIRIEGEDLVAASKAEGGQTQAQNMTAFPDHWSGDSQLWWHGGQPGDVCVLTLDGLEPGNHDLTLFPTTARDYARVKVIVNGQIREADLFSEDVVQGTPLHFENVNVSPSEPLRVDIHITGKNPAAVPSHMVGVDRIEVSKSGKE